MIFQFPSYETLRLALTSGVVPNEVGIAPVKAGFGEEGQFWVQPAKKLTHEVIGELERFGVRSLRSEKGLPVAMDQRLRCWHQLIPLCRETTAIEQGQKAPVLFVLHQGEQLPSLVGEILRLGNDRQSFCYLSNGSEGQAMLRVIGPPYYSLLRALERDGQQAAPRAYVEQSPRVWVEIGHRHELADRVKPPTGKLLLLRPPRDWILVDEVPFRDIYELLDFQLPDSTADWKQAELQQRISVSLRLEAGGGSDAAELWVLREGGAKELEQLVRNSDDRLLSRLAFAVGESNGKTTIVLRVRPSKQPPPVLVLAGVAFRSYLKLPNLFLPVGQRLHPPLRRDAVAKLLGQDKTRIAWLYPTDDGGFIPETISDAAFRPLSDWIDYALDCEHKALSAWVASHRFDFDSFICSDDRPAKPKPAPKPRPERERDQASTESKAVARKKRRTAGRKDSELDEDFALLVDSKTSKQKPNELQRRLRNLEEQFRNNESPLDSLDHQQLWQEMALLNTALKHRHDATVCWSNAFWEQSKLPVAAVKTWLECESRGAPNMKFIEDDLDRLDEDNAALPADASVVVAYVVWAARQESPPEVLTNRLPIVARFLERQEPYLPVRTAWLAWVAATKLAGGDVLAMARARDRLLERLFQHGMRPEFDMPGFMRAGGGAETERFRELRDHVTRLRDQANNWIVEPPLPNKPQTKAYADLIFAFALAHLGETQHCHKLLDAASKVLSKQDDVHRWVRDAYGQRVGQALEGQANQGRLNEELLNRLDAMDRLGRYKADRLRNYSRILEPTERIDPYRRWHNRYTDVLSRKLAELYDINDRNELKTRLAELTNGLQSKRQDASEQVRILDTALELAPRLGESFADQVLAWIDPVQRNTRDVVGRAVLLDKGLLVAAHFGKVDHVQALVVRFETELPEIVSSYLTLNIQHNPENKEKIDTIDSLFSQSFRGMRKLGMREQIGRLFGRLDELLHQHAQTKKGKRVPNSPVDPVRSHKLLLSVAAGWFYFDQQERAQRIVAEVRKTLFEGNLPPIDQRTLACAYIRAIGQASVEWVLPCIEELFDVKKGKRQLARIEDNMTTASHFSISQLDVIETVVLTLVSDDFSLNAESRRWLDEDEFLVRRRIHRDVREALAKAEEYGSETDRLA